MIRVLSILFLIFLVGGCIEEEQPTYQSLAQIHINVTETGTVEMPIGPGLDFGGLPPGTVTEKIIGLNGSEQVRLGIEGQLQNWTKTIPQNVTLNGTEQKIIVRISIPENATVGQYTGQLIDYD